KPLRSAWVVSGAWARAVPGRAVARARQRRAGAARRERVIRILSRVRSEPAMVPGPVAPGARAGGHVRAATGFRYPWALSSAPPAWPTTTGSPIHADPRADCNHRAGLLAGLAAPAAAGPADAVAAGDRPPAPVRSAGDPWLHPCRLAAPAVQHDHAVLLRPLR